MSKILNSLMITAIMLSAAPVAAAHRDDPAARLARAIGDRVAGKATDCISLASIGSTEIIDGKAILYRVGSTLYVNEPRSGASSLDDDDILVTRTSGSQLCSIDTVNLVDRGSHFQAGFVSLGQFVPYRKIATRD